MSLHKHLAATLAAVSGFTPEVEQYIADLPIETRTSVTLAVQELLVNIVRHGYDGQTGTIEFEMTRSNTTINLRVIEQAATPFTMPANIPEPDPLDLPESGLGLFIIQQAFDVVECKRVNNSNHWHLTKVLGGS